MPSTSRVSSSSGGWRSRSPATGRWGRSKELELDHRTGKVSDEDYRALVGPLRREAVEALRALEPRAEATARVKADRPG